MGRGEFCTIMQSATIKAKTTGEILDVEHRRAGDFDAGLLELVELVSAQQGFDTMRLYTVAAHDGIGWPMSARPSSSPSRASAASAIMRRNTLSQRMLKLARVYLSVVSRLC